jgi:hypothetical protein
VVRFCFALAVACVAIACNPKSLRPGFCHVRSDCPSGMTCNMKFRCEVMGDGSADGSEAGDGGDAEVPFRCTGNGQCRDGGANVCERDAGVCVECLEDGDCPDTTRPICNLSARTCERCTTDSQCLAKVPNPGICMFHQDGRCATDSETIYVKNSAGCTMTAGSGGTLAAPYCLSQDGINTVVQGRSLIVMSGPDALTEWSVMTAPAEPVTVVGQSAATVSPGARIGVRISAGNVSIRKLAVSGGTNVGVVVDGSAELHMNGCTIQGNTKGGIFVDGAAFDITNTTIAANGPGDDMGAAWGGLRIKNPPANDPKTLQFLTVQNNNQVGVSCSGPVSGMGIIASGNAGGVEISPSCGFPSCGAPSLTCGAQP